MFIRFTLSHVTYPSDKFTIKINIYFTTAVWEVENGTVSTVCWSNKLLFFSNDVLSINNK